VLHQRTGLLVPAGDEAALAAALDSLIADPARRAEMGRAGRAHALGTFGAAGVARRYASLYRAAVVGS
jgi:glycosyltransferase involved in cell wall biosynthesis